MRSAPASRGGQLACALALLAVTAAALLGAGAGGSESRTAADAAAGRTLSELSADLTPAVARRVERIRGLEFYRVPRPSVVDAERLNELGERDARRLDADRGLGADEAAARLLGLMEPDEELESILGATGDIAAAAYDTRRDRLYVVEDAVSADRAFVEFVLAHELVHALEDARFEFPEQAVRTSDDAALARLALIEGSATAAMIEYARRHLDPGELVGLAELDARAGEVPEFVVELLEWAYLGGAGFVDHLYGVTDGWDLVDAAIATRPPASTEQVLHPIKYLRNERPLPVATPGDALRRRGWRRAGGGNLGEVGTEQLLRVSGERLGARWAAAGWGGDRYTVWARRGEGVRCDPEDCRDQVALAMRWRWDSARDAEEFAATARTYVDEGLGGKPAGTGTWRLDGGAAALRRTGTTVTLGLAPTPALARAAAG